MTLPYYVVDSGRQGSGVFAGKTFLTGELILHFTGTVTPIEEITDFTHFLQISPDTFLSPSGQADDYVNHNCEPNCAIYLEGEQLVLRALKVILPDEELGFDYGTIMFSEPTLFTCFCGSSCCRQEIGGFTSLPPALQEYYVSINVVPLLTRYTLDSLLLHTVKPACSGSSDQSILQVVVAE